MTLDAAVSTFSTAAGGAIVALFVSWWKRRQQSREDVNQAMADLLEMRLMMRMYIGYIEYLQKELSLPAAIMPLVKKHVLEIIPSAPDFHVRYNKAVDAVSRFDPILGYKLRSRDSLKTLVGTMANVPDHPSLKDFSGIDLKIATMGVEGLEEMLPRIAFGSNPLLWWRVRGIVRTKVEIPPEVHTLIGEAKKVLATMGFDLVPKAATANPAGTSISKPPGPSSIPPATGAAPPSV